MQMSSTDKNSKHLHQVSEAAQQSMDQLATDATRKAKEMAQDTANKASEYYNQASSWLEQNYGKTLGLLGLMAVTGIAGYLIGRNRDMDQSEMTSSTYHS